jgi:hypothetical protein
MRKFQCKDCSRHGVLKHVEGRGFTDYCFMRGQELKQMDLALIRNEIKDTIGFCRDFKYIYANFMEVE